MACLVVVAGLLLVGCTAHGEQPSAEPSRFLSGSTATATSSAPATGGDLDFTTPYAPYMLTTTERATLSYARAMLVNACVSRFGFSYPTRPFSETLSRQRDSDLVMMSRLFGPTDRAVAEKWGYLPAPSDDGEQAWALEEELSAKPDFVLVLTGEAEGRPVTNQELDGTTVPEGGCFGEVDRLIGTGGSAEGGVPDMARGLWAGLSREEQALPEYQLIESEWAKCMTERGFGEIKRVMNDPFVTKLVEERQHAVEPTQKEIEVALADIDCKASTDLVARLQAVTTKYQQGVVDARLLALQENRAALETVVKKATEEVEKAGGFE